MKNRMARFFNCAPGLVLPLLFLPLLTYGQTKHFRTIELTSSADIIVVGTVSALKMEWNGDKSRIQTRVTIGVDETMKGDIDDGSLTVLIPGGEVDGVGEWYSHSAHFKADEEVVVFATKDSRGEYRVTAGNRGKFLVTKDTKTGAKIIPKVGSLQEFRRQIMEDVKSRQTLRRDG